MRSSGLLVWLSVGVLALRLWNSRSCVCRASRFTVNVHSSSGTQIGSF